jgi:hypothetical protein
LLLEFFTYRAVEEPLKLLADGAIFALYRRVRRVDKEMQVKFQVRLNRRARHEKTDA